MRLGHSVIGPAGGSLHIDGPPQALDEYINSPRALAIHTDFDVAGNQHLHQRGRGELAALLCVEDLGRTMFRQRLFHILYREFGLWRDRLPPRQNALREPIEHGSLVDGLALYF